MHGEARSRLESSQSIFLRDFYAASFRIVAFFFMHITQQRRYSFYNTVSMMHSIVVVACCAFFLASLVIRVSVGHKVSKPSNGKRDGVCVLAPLLL